MSTNPYMFIATEPLGPIWPQAGFDGKQLQNDAWHSWASNYVWIPSYIAYGLVDMVPWDAVAPITAVDGKGASPSLEKIQGKGPSLKRPSDGKSSLAPDEPLGSHCGGLVSQSRETFRIQGKSSTKTCCANLLCIWLLNLMRRTRKSKHRSRMLGG